MSNNMEASAAPPIQKPEYLEAVERLKGAMRDAVAAHHDSILWWYDELTPDEVNRVTCSDAETILRGVLSGFR